MMKFILFYSLLTMYSIYSLAQNQIPLYPDSIPNSRPAPNEETSEITGDSILIISKISQPTISVFLPPAEKATGAAVVICPGGGYRIVAAGHEGFDVAKQFNDMGIAAFVVKYRIPNNATMINRQIGPLQDVQRGIQYARENAEKYGIDTNRVGIMGFSAGGHLAASAGTHFDTAYIPNPKSINLRPDFMILIYPVISFTDSLGHSGSREQLLGKDTSAEKIQEFSNEFRVTPNTPPSFLTHAKDDDVVKVENSQLFYQQLQKNNVKAKLYLYEKGGHGFGMNNPTSNAKWMDMVKDWLRSLGLISSKL